MLAATIAAAPDAAAQEVLLNAPLTRAEAQQWTNRLCRAAQGLRKGDVEPAIARTLYLRAIRTGAGDTSCAASGLAALAAAAKETQSTAAKGKPAKQAAELMKQAEALSKAGYDSEAQAKVREALAADPTATVPPELVKPAVLDQAKALADAGYENEAQAKVREALAADPNVVVPSALVKPDRQPSWLREAAGNAGIWVITIGLIAGGLAAVLALLYGIGRVAHAHLKRRIAVQDFAGGTEGVAAAHVAALRQHSEALNNAHGAGRLDRAAGANDKLTAASNIGALSVQAGAMTELLAVLGRMLPGRTWHLTGDLLPFEPEIGVGLALMLSRQPSGKVISTATLRESQFLATPSDTASATASDQAVAWQRLSLAAAAFVLFEDRRAFRSTPRQDFDKLGTESWRSFAMTVSAAAFYRWDLATARRLNRQALALDGEYKDAKFDLAVVELRDAGADASALADAAQRFDDLANSDGVDQNDPLWYKARFWQTVAQLSSNPVQNAATTAQALFDPQTTHWWDREDKLPPKLSRLLPGMRLMGLVLLATALERANESAEEKLAVPLRELFAIPAGVEVTGAKIVSAITADPKLRTVAAYNLACFHARLMKDEWTTAALERLKEALERGGPEMARSAWKDHGLTNLRAHADAEVRAELTAAGYVPDP